MNEALERVQAMFASAGVDVEFTEVQLVTEEEVVVDDSDDV